MLSKRLGTPVPVYTGVTNYGFANYKAIEFANQYEYDLWLREHVQYKPGDLLCFKGITDLTTDSWPVVTVCERVEDDVTDLKYEEFGQSKGQPAIYQLRTVRSGAYSTFNPETPADVRMDVGAHLRMLMSQEVDFVMGHAVLSSRLKQILQRIPGSGFPPV